jgi:hypothetical protein
MSEADSRSRSSSEELGVLLATEAARLVERHTGMVRRSVKRETGLGFERLAGP